MNKIIDYMICAQESYLALQNEVRGAIKDGWQPLAGISSPRDKYAYYAQAMAKYAPENTINVQPRAAIMKLYSLALSSSKRQEYTTINKAYPEAVVCETLEQAIEYGLAWIKSLCRVDDGWGQHQCSAIEIKQELLDAVLGNLLNGIEGL